MEDKPKAPESWARFSIGSPRWLHPFLWLEWLTEWVVYWLGRWAFVELVKTVAGLSLVWAAVEYLSSGEARQRALDDQRKAKHYQAWQTINSARGQSGSGGRIDALEDLNRDGVSLASIDASGAWMRGIQLRGANLMAAGLDSAVLIEANLADTNLFGANLKGANLSKANLQNATLVGADLTQALLLGADLRGAKLTGATLDHGLFFFADLRGAHLARATLQEANLDLANLQSADLSEANVRAATMSGADLQSTIFRDVRNWREIKSLKDAKVHAIAQAPPDFMAWAAGTMGATATAIPAAQWEKSRRAINFEMLMRRPEATK